MPPLFPFKSIERGNGSEEEITFLTPEQTQTLLHCADGETRPLFALAAFAGIRWSEIERLRWEDIREHEIVISAAKAKTRSRRVIEIARNLKRFLEPCRGRTGSVLPLATEQSTKRQPSAKRLERLRDEPVRLEPAQT